MFYSTERNIISVSRRTDIPAFYSDWFFRRLDAGFVTVRNPYNPLLTRRVSLRRDNTDGFVFWTKNPAPMLERTDELHKKCLCFYFHFTINGYGRDIEPNLPDIDERIETFRELAFKLGRSKKPDKVIWRYDPILINEKHSAEWHVDTFGKIAARLEGSTSVAVVSFIDTSYPKVYRRTSDLLLHRITPEMKIAVMKRLNHIASAHDIRIAACAEMVDLSACGISKAHCISDRIFSNYCIFGEPDPNDEVNVEGIFDTPLKEKDKNQRPLCGCISGVDIGAYNTCRHGCIYCYASSDDDNAAPDTLTD